MVDAVRAGICSGWHSRRAVDWALIYTAARRVPPARLGAGAAGGTGPSTVLLLTPNTCAAAVAPLSNQIPPNLHGALFRDTFHRTCPLPTVFSTVCDAVGLCGQCWRAGVSMVQYVSEQIFFQMLKPPVRYPGKALQKQTQENAPMCSIKIIIVDKNWR